MKLTDLLLIAVIILQLFLLFKPSKDTPENPKIDAIYRDIDSLKAKDAKLLLKRDTLVRELTTIHNETTHTIEKISTTPDSMQFIITEQLIREHRRLDSL